MPTPGGDCSYAFGLSICGAGEARVARHYGYRGGSGAVFALVPDGLAEPTRDPLYPQRYAEVMAGEIATGPRDGRPPWRLEELRAPTAMVGSTGHSRTHRLSDVRVRLLA